MSKIAENARLAQRLREAQQTALELARAMGDEGLAESLEARYGAGGARPAAKPAARGAGESSVTRTARERAAEAPVPS